MTMIIGQVSMTDQMQYRNIAISGLPGAGSTTLLKRLRETLSDQGWIGFSGGEYLRQFAGGLAGPEHHDAGDYSEEVDRRTDMEMRRRLQDEKCLIVESWLAGFLAQGIPGVLKVLISCSNDLDRAARLAKRDAMDDATAILKAYNRLKTNVDKWSVMYQQEWQDWVVKAGTLPPHVKIFFWNPRLYDLVIDTAVYNEQEVLDQVLRELQAPALIGQG